MVKASLASNPCSVMVPEIKKVKETPPAVAGLAGTTWEEATRRATNEEPAKKSSHPMTKEVLAGHPCACHMELLDLELRLWARPGRANSGTWPALM